MERGVERRESFRLETILLTTPDEWPERHPPTSDLAISSGQGFIWQGSLRLEAGEHKEWLRSGKSVRFLDSSAQEPIVQKEIRFAGRRKTERKKMKILLSPTRLLVAIHMPNLMSLKK